MRDNSELPISGGTGADLAADRQAGLVRLLQRLRERGYQFVTPTPATHARVLARRSDDHAHCIEDALGWSLPFDDDLLPSDIFACLLDAGALKATDRGWQARLRVSSLGPDLFAHSAFPTATDDAVFFGPDTYRFARFIRANPVASTTGPPRIADIGTGAGVGAIVAARLYPGATIVATDINRRALRCAQANAAAAGVRIETHACTGLKDVTGAFDLVLINPPYIADEKGRAYRNGGKHHGAQLSVDLARVALSRVADGGTVLLYTGSAIVGGRDWLREALAPLNSAADIRYEELDPDVFGEELDTPAYADVDRIAVVGVTLTRRTL